MTALFRKITAIIALFAVVNNVHAQDIAYIQPTKSWYYVYDQNGRKLSSLSTNNGELKGYSATFYVIATKNWIYTYDTKSRKIASISVSSAGEVVGVAGDTFSTRLGSWIYIWDKHCKKVATKSITR